MNTKTTDLKSMIAGLFFTCILSTLSYAQNVGINGTGNAPDASAMLDIEATNKGLLVPRVALTGTTDATTILTPATSLLVYNTATAGGINPGYYYNSGTTIAPIWKSFSSPSKFTVPFGDGRFRIIDASPSPMCGPNSIAGESNNNYGNPASSAPNATKYNTEAIFTAQSNCTFNGLNGWINEPFDTGATVTVSLYRFRQISGSTPPMGVLVGSTIVNCANSSNLYSFIITAPGTPFTAQQGDMFLLFFSQPAAGANFNVNGSMEFINN
jgi:hypothetical protein